MFTNLAIPNWGRGCPQSWMVGISWLKSPWKIWMITRATSFFGKHPYGKHWKFMDMKRIEGEHHLPETLVWQFLRKIIQCTYQSYQTIEMCMKNPWRVNAKSMVCHQHGLEDSRATVAIRPTWLPRPQPQHPLLCNMATILPVLLQWPFLFRNHLSAKGGGMDPWWIHPGKLHSVSHLHFQRLFTFDSLVAHFAPQPVWLWLLPYLLLLPFSHHIRFYIFSP